jgi:hypothetical protein
VSAVDLLARLRLEADAGNAAKVVGDVRADIEQLGKAGEKAGEQLQKAGDAAGQVAAPATQVKEAAQGAAQGLDAAREAAEKLKPAADEAGKSSEDLAGQMKGLADQAIAESLGQTGGAAKGAAVDLDGAGAAAGRTTGMMGGLVTSLVGGLGVAAASAIVSLAVDSFNGYQEDLKEGAIAAAEGSGELAEQLRDLAVETADLTGDTLALIEATGWSAQEAIEAADAYDIQAVAARDAAKAIREKTAAELQIQLKEDKKELKQMQRAQSGGGFWDAFTTDQDEKDRAALRKLNQQLSGINSGYGMIRSEDQITADFQAGKFTGKDRQAVVDYFAQTRGSRARRQEIARREAAIRATEDGMVPGAPDQGLEFQSEEIELESTRRPRGGRRGRGGMSDAEREAKERERRLDQAADFVSSAEAETKAIEAQIVAMAKGPAALDAWRVAEAGRQAVAQAGLDDTANLTQAEADAAAKVRTAAEDREKAAIAADKAGRYQAAAQSLDQLIAKEEAYALALQGGEKALADYERAEFVRQELERAGEGLTEEQTAALMQKADALFSIKAANDMLADDDQFREELRLAAMTTDQRERETRALELKRQLLRANAEMTEAEADQVARMTAAREQAQRRQAEDISKLKTSMRDAWIEGGELGIDQVADYAERKLREAIYDQFVGDVIDLTIDATVKVVTDGLEDMFDQFLRELSTGGGGQGGGFLSWLFGQGAAKPGAAEQSGGSGMAGLGMVGSIASSLGGLFGGSAAGVGAGLGGAAAGMAGGGGLFGALGGLLATPVGWIGAAVAAVAMLPQIHDSYMDVSKRYIQAFGGNESWGESPWAALFSPTVNGIASLFMNGNSNNGGRLSFDDGFFDVTGTKASKKRKDQLGQTGDFITEMVEALEAIGISARGIIKSVQAGDRDGSKVTTADGTIYTSKGANSEAIAELVVKALLSEAEFEDPALRAMVDEMVAANRNWEQILDRMEKFVSAHAARKDLDLELLRYTDPRAAALRELEEDQEARRKAFEAYNRDALYTPEQWATIEQQLTQLEAEELEAALEQLGDAATEAAAALADAAPRLKEWLEAMGFSDAAQLNPFEERELAMEQYERELAKARSGDADALSTITQYAERLLQVDAEATSSAQERLALYNAVMAAIAALSLQTDPIPLPTTTPATAEAAAGAETPTLPDTAANDNGTVAVSPTPTADGTVASTATSADVVAAVERLRTDVLARLDALTGGLPAGLAVLGDGLGGLLGRIAEVGQGQLVAVETLTDEVRDANAHSRVASARPAL